MRILSIATTLLALQAAAVHAETTTVQATQAAGSSFIELLQFNPNAGLLTEVALTLTGNVSGHVSAEATSRRGGPFVFTFNLKSTISLGLPGEQPGVLLSVTPSWTGTSTRTSFDGQLDFSGSSGVSLTGLQATATAQTAYNDPSVLGIFTGVGMIKLPVLAQDLSSIGDVANYRGGFDASSLASATVTYTYSLRERTVMPSSEQTMQPVPEPGTWALMLAGLGLVGWLAARRRA
jgi:hypothetical protein